MDNVETIKARLVFQGANIPATSDAERRLHENGILCIPDFIANAGGVIAAAVEYQRGSQRSAFHTIAAKISENTEEVLKSARSNKTSPREAAKKMAQIRLQKAIEIRPLRALMISLSGNRPG